ncbi:MAG: hypothetical protein ACUVRV_11330 [Cyanobacteriota bacterium]
MQQTNMELEAQTWINGVVGGLALLILGGGMLMMFTTLFTTRGPKPDQTQLDPKDQ